MRNPDITLCRMMLIVYKMMLDWRSRNAPPITALTKRGAALNVDLTMFDMLSQGGPRKEVCKRRAALWNSQKACEAGRMEWLNKKAEERAEAAGDKD